MLEEHNRRFPPGIGEVVLVIVELGAVRGGKSGHRLSSLGLWPGPFL